MNTRHVPKFFVSLVVLLCAIAVLPEISLAKQKNQGNGYSYLHINISGRDATNLVYDQRYKGWLQISSVRAAAGQEAANKTSTQPAPEPKWALLPTILHSGRSGAGKIQFGAGDNGAGLDPLIDAQKHGTKAAFADLDLYDESSGKFIGKYRLKSIHVLSLEDVQASACAMYEITMSFESAEKIKP